MEEYEEQNEKFKSQNEIAEQNYYDENWLIANGYNKGFHAILQKIVYHHDKNMRIVPVDSLKVRANGSTDQPTPPTPNVPEWEVLTSW